MVTYFIIGSIFAGISLLFCLFCLSINIKYWLYDIPLEDQYFSVSTDELMLILYFALGCLITWPFIVILTVTSLTLMFYKYKILKNKNKIDPNRSFLEWVGIKRV